MFPVGVIAAVAFVPIIIWVLDATGKSQLILAEGAAALAFMTVFYVAHTKRVADAQLKAIGEGRKDRENSLHPILVLEAYRSSIRTGLRGKFPLDLKTAVERLGTGVSDPGDATELLYINKGNGPALNARAYLADCNGSQIAALYVGVPPLGAGDHWVVDSWFKPNLLKVPQSLDAPHRIKR